MQYRTTLGTSDPNKKDIILEMSSSDVPAAEEEVVQVQREEGQAVLGMPEHSHPGESASNGFVERGVQSLEDLVRTMKHALQERTNGRIPGNHHVLNVLVQYAGVLMTKCAIHGGGATATVSNDGESFLKGGLGLGLTFRQ